MIFPFGFLGHLNEDNLFWILIAVFVIVALLCGKMSEKFVSTSVGTGVGTSVNGCRLPDPQTTGMERPLWGRLQSVVVPGVDKVTQYETMHGLPWCAEPARGSNEKECLKRNPPVIQVPYEMNKI